METTGIFRVNLLMSLLLLMIEEWGNGDGLFCKKKKKKAQTETSQFSSLSTSRAAPSPSWQHVSGPPSLPEWFWSRRWSRWTQSRPHRSRYGCFPVLLSSTQEAFTCPPLMLRSRPRVVCAVPRWIFQPVRASKRWPAGGKPQRLFSLSGFTAETHRLIHWWSIFRCSWRRSWTTWCPAWLWDPSSPSGSLGTRSRWARGLVKRCTGFWSSSRLVPLLSAACAVWAVRSFFIQYMETKRALSATIERHRQDPTCCCLWDLMDGVGATRHFLAISIFVVCLASPLGNVSSSALLRSQLWPLEDGSVLRGLTFCPSPSRWRRTTRMSWTSTAACACPSACSWWRRRPASRRRSRPSSGPSCCCTATPTSSATREAPRWCTRTLRAPTRKSRWAGALSVFRGAGMHRDVVSVRFTSWFITLFPISPRGVSRKWDELWEKWRRGTSSHLCGCCWCY